jgi:Ca-activated chloride channel family protein
MRKHTYPVNAWRLQRVVTTLLLCVLAVWPLQGQAPASFYAAARLVVVHVAVRDSHGEPITTLDRSAFTVFEDGKPQPVTIFLRDDTPVSLGIVIDSSGSMRLRREAVEAAALAFARASNPLDEIFILNFADKAHVDVPFTSDAHALEAGIARMDCIGGTAMRDAVHAAATYLNGHASRDRKALLLITDGLDNASLEGADKVTKEAEATGIAIYAIGLPLDDAAKARHARGELGDLTERTGGLSLYLATMDDIGPTALRVAREIRQLYTLAYTPRNQSSDGSYRKIRVVVNGGQRSSVRARAGYYATPDSWGRAHGS